MGEFNENTTFNPRDISAVGPDDKPGHYYVSVIDGRKYALALGPFDTHAEALGRVKSVEVYCNEQSCKAAFYGYGTARLEPGDPAPDGKLNEALMEVTRC